MTSPHFLSFLSSPCHQLCLCVSAWFYPLGNETEGNPKSTDKISLRNSFTVHNELLLSKNRNYKIPTGGFSSCVLMEIKKDREVGHTQISCGNSAQMCVTRSPGTVSFKGKTGLSWYTLRAWWRLSSVCERGLCHGQTQRNSTQAYWNRYLDCVHSRNEPMVNKAQWKLCPWSGVCYAIRYESLITPGV